MVDPDQTVASLVQAFVTGTASVEEFRTRFSRVLWDPEHPPDIAWAVLLVMSQYTAGNLDEDGLRRSLRPLAEE
jgi:hypothetical protein